MFFNMIIIIIILLLIFYYFLPPSPLYSVICRTGASAIGQQSALVVIGNRAGVTRAQAKFQYKVRLLLLLFSSFKQTPLKQNKNSFVHFICTNFLDHQ